MCEQLYLITKKLVVIFWDRVVGNQLQYRFTSARPNNRVMTAALTRSYEKTVQFWVGHRTAAVSMKQTSVAAADYSSTSGRTRRSYVDSSWQSWCVGSEDHYEPLVIIKAIIVKVCFSIVLNYSEDILVFCCSFKWRRARVLTEWVMVTLIVMLQTKRTAEEWEVSCGCWAVETIEWKYWQLLGQSISDQWWHQLAMASTATSAARNVAAAAAAAAEWHGRKPCLCVNRLHVAVRNSIGLAEPDVGLNRKFWS